VAHHKNNKNLAPKQGPTSGNPTKTRTDLGFPEVGPLLTSIFQNLNF
jgi:hypothetical protein